MHDLFVKPSTWMNWFNLEHQALYIMCARGGWVLRNIDFNSFTAPTDLVAGAFAIPGELLALVGVWETDTAGRFRRLKYTNGLDGLHQFPGATAITGQPREFWLSDFSGSTTEATSIFPYPTPTSGTFISVGLNGPTPTQTVLDTFTLPLGIEELIVLKMARRALIKEESNTDGVDKLIQIEAQKVEEYIWNRNLANTPKIRNTDATERGWGWAASLQYPSADEWAWL